MSGITEQPDKMGKAFLDIVNQGKTRWSVYFISIFVILGIWLLGSVIFMFLVLGQDILKGIQPLDDTPSVAYLFAIKLSFIPLIIGIWCGVCCLHRRPFLTLVTPYSSFRKHRFWQGFKWQIILMILAIIIEELIFPGTYIYSLDPSQFYKFVIIILLLTPLQACSEELLFRGYFLQAVGHLVRQPFVLILINGLAFMIPHLSNPESAHGVIAWLSYFAWGVFLTLITLKDNGAELAIGIHIANNMFTGIFVNYKGSALPTNSVFMAEELRVWYGLISYIFVAVVLYWIFFRNHKSESVVK